MSCLRPLARGTLAATAILCLIFTGLSIFCTLAAGTLQMDGDYPTGPGYLLLSSLSVVRFKGIFSHPNNDTGSYEITLHWFLNAFGWEWPYAAWERSCGIVNNINGFLPGPALTLPGDLIAIARRLKFPEEEYWCLGSDSSHSGGVCHNHFFDAWYSTNLPSTSFGTAIPLFGYYFAGIMVLTTAITELIVRCSPRLAKCYCPSFISRRGLCPCLKDDEEATPAVRNRFRVWNLGVLAMAYAFSCLTLLLRGLQLKTYLSKVDLKVEGMNAQLGEGFLWLSGATLIAVTLALGCLHLRGLIEPAKSWMKEQGISEDEVNLDQTRDGSKEDVDGPV